MTDSYGRPACWRNHLALVAVLLGAPMRAAFRAVELDPPRDAPKWDAATRRHQGAT